MLRAYQCSSLSASKVFIYFLMKEGFWHLFYWTETMQLSGRRCFIRRVTVIKIVSMFSVVLETCFLLPSVRGLDHNGLMDCNNTDNTLVDRDFVLHDCNVPGGPY